MTRGFVQVAPELYRFAFLPYDLGNVYLLGDVLLDAGLPSSSGRILRALEGRSVVAHALTHGHFDHGGGSRAVCDALGVTLWCGEGDRAAVESGNPRHLYPGSRHLVARIAGLVARPPPCPVARVLREGDVVGGFTVVETPGHTPGHLAYWRESDRVLVLGDVLFHRNPITACSGLAEPYRWLAFDHERNRQSLRRLSDLEPALICFGHGAPLADGDVFLGFVGRERAGTAA